MMVWVQQSIERTLLVLKTRRDLADAATMLVARISAAVFAFVVQAYLARKLGLDQYGVYVALWTWLIIANHLSVFGFSESSLRFLPRYIERKQYHWVKSFLKTGFIFTFLGSILLGAGGIIFLWFFENAVSPEYLAAIVVLAIGMPVMTLELYLEGVSRSFGWYMLTIIPGYVIRPILIALGVIIACKFDVVPDAALVLGIAVVITCMIVAAQSFIIWQHVCRKFSTTKNDRPKKLWFKASLPLTFSTSVDQLFAWSDILILAYLVPAPEVAVYFAAQRSMALANFIQYAFTMVSSRQFSIANAMRNRKELQNRISSATRWTFWLTVPAVIITLIAGYPLLRLFGSEFVSGLPVMAVLGIGLIAKASVGQGAELLVVLGHQRANLYISTIGIISNVIISMLFVPYFGILGAAYATALTLTLRSLALIFIIKNLTGLWVMVDMPKHLKETTKLPSKLA